MNYLLYCLLWNMVFVTAASLILSLLGATRCLYERPALRHGLWMLVLLKFVTPPLFAVPLLPAMQAEQPTRTALPPIAESDRTAEEQVTPVSVESAEFSVHQSTHSSDGNHAGLIISKALLCLSLFVTLVFAVLAVVQQYRLKKISAYFAEPEQRLSEMLQSVCKSCQLSNAPDLVVVNTVCSPMLWVGFRRTTIILPRALAETLSEEQLLQILAHEIGHLVRKDYLPSLLACGVISLFWWNPIAWLARREMFIAAETCCDAFAIDKTPGSRQSYARTLLAAVDYAVHEKTVLPVWGTQFIESRSLERRITMVASSRVKTTLTRSHRGAILCLGLLALMLVPVQADQKRVSGNQVAVEQTSKENLPENRQQEKAESDPPNTRSANLPTIPNVKLISWSGAKTSSRAYYFKTVQAAGSFAKLVETFQLADQFKVEISDTKPMLTDQDKRICIMPANIAKQLELDGDKYVLLQGTREDHSRLEKVMSALETK